MVKRFYIIDQSLKSFSGHYYGYSASIAAAARKRGFESLIFTHKAASNFKNDIGAAFIPWFSHEWSGAKEFSLLGLINNFIRYVYRILAKRKNIRFNSLFLSYVPAHKLKHEFHVELAKLFSVYSLTSDDQVFIHTIGTAQLQGLLDYILSSQQYKLPYFHILLRRRVEEELVWFPNSPTIKEVISSFANARLWPDKVSFYTDTKNLSDQYDTLSSIRFITAPIAYDLPPLSYNFSQAKAPITLAYLGDARQEKGFNRLPAIVRDIPASLARGMKVHFIVQACHDGTDSNIIKAVAELVSMSHIVNLIPRALSHEEFYALLEQADIVLLPYEAKQYGFRSSGILSQALAAGKVVIVPAGTWMAEQAAKDRAVIWDPASSLLQAVKKAIEDYENLKPQATAFAMQWRQQHTPENLFDLLDSTCRPLGVHPR